MVNLASLSLLRNGSAVADELLRAARQGDNGAAVLREVAATGLTAEQLGRAKLLLREDLLVQGQARGYCRRKQCQPGMQ